MYNVSSEFIIITHFVVSSVTTICCNWGNLGNKTNDFHSYNVFTFKILVSILLQFHKTWYNDHYGHFIEQRIETENHTIFFSGQRVHFNEETGSYKKKIQQIFLQYFYSLSFSNLPENSSFVKVCLPMSGIPCSALSLPLISVFSPGKSYMELARGNHRWHTHWEI